MNVKPLFQNDKDITLNEYLRRCGVDDPVEYLNPHNDIVESPSLYDNIDEAMKVLEDAIHGEKNIVIVCDSDCDGYCSSAIAWSFLVRVFRVHYSRVKVLFHTSKQHGLSKDIMEQISQIGINNIDLVWLPDAGTNDADQSAIFAPQDVPVLITDHHEKERENSYAIVVNNQTSDNVTNKDLCGAGVTHKVVSEYCERHYREVTCREDWDFTEHILCLVALATVGDVCDLRSLENRMIMKWAFKNIPPFGTVFRYPFLQAMCDEFISEKVVTPTSLAWNIVPKINAVCRGNDQELKRSLFHALAQFRPFDEGIRTDFSQVIEGIKKAHATQRNTVNELYEKALDIKPIGDRVKIFEFDNTPYTGLIATKLSDHYACPCMVVHKHGDIYSGSMRSPCELKNRLNDSGLMTLCMGHSQACGVGWKAQNTNKLSTYCEQLDLSPSDKVVMYSYDDVFIDPMVFDITKQGASLWGTGIPEPTIHLKNITINGQYIKEIGANKTTIKFLYGDIEIIGFFMSKEKKKSLHVGEDVNMSMEIIGTPSINTFRDKDTKQIVIKEWEVCQK